MVCISRRLPLIATLALCGMVAPARPTWSADLAPGPHTQLVAPVAPTNQWQFNFTPYGWMTSVNGDVTVRGNTVDIDENFFQIVEKSDSLMALMGYFEARKGPLSLFTDVVWEDLSFPGHKTFDLNRSATRRPFANFPEGVVSVDTNLNARANVQVGYESTIVQSGIGFEIVKWSNAGSQTALDVLGGARYWNQEADLNLNASGTLTVDVTGEATINPRDILRRVLQNRGFTLDRPGAKLLQRLIERRFGPGGEQTISRSVQIEFSRALATARSGDLEWVDPFVGGRIRHKFGDDKEINLEADVGGFGAGSDFSWQVVGTYGFNVNCFGTPLHTVIGYRALAVDYSENGPFGKNALDFVQHGPVMGVSFRW